MTTPRSGQVYMPVGVEMPVPNAYTFRNPRLEGSADALNTVSDLEVRVQRAAAPRPEIIERHVAVACDWICAPLARIVASYADETLEVARFSIAPGGHTRRRAADGSFMEPGPESDIACATGDSFAMFAAGDAPLYARLDILSIDVRTT